MPTKLADTRTSPTIQDAAQQLAEIRRLKVERECIIAVAEDKIAAVTRKAQAQTDPIDRQIEVAAKNLGDFILANRHLFSERRTHATPDGKFGLREASRLEVTNADALLERILDNGYDDCVKITRSLVKPAITRRLKDGEDFPGCHVQTGDVAFYDVSKVLISKAVESARASRAGEGS